MLSSTPRLSTTSPLPKNLIQLYFLLIILIHEKHRTNMVGIGDLVWSLLVFGNPYHCAHTTLQE
jgi:hypothetical protein